MKIENLFSCHLNHDIYHERCIAHDVLQHWDILSRIENLKIYKYLLKYKILKEEINNSFPEVTPRGLL